MRTLPRISDLDARSWSTATWALPFAVQFVLLLSVIWLWLLGKTTYFAEAHERGWFLSAAVITLLVTLPIAAVFLTQQSSRVRGVAVAVAGSSFIVAIGMITYAVFVLRW